MAKSPYKRRTYGTVKEAVTKLVTANGGSKAAAGVTRVEGTHMHRYTDDACPSDHMPVDIVAVLERRAGCHPVTEWLAHEAGCLLVPVQVAPDGEFDADLAEMAQHFANLFAEHVAAKKDGRYDRDEAARVMQAGDAMVKAWLSARRDLSAVAQAQQPAASVTPIRKGA